MSNILIHVYKFPNEPGDKSDIHVVCRYSVFLKLLNVTNVKIEDINMDPILGGSVQTLRHEQ